MTILLLEKIHPDAISLLREANQTVRLAETPPELNAVLRAEKVSAIITRDRGVVPGELMEQCPTLAVVARCGVTPDNIDLRAAMERNIPVVCAPDSTTNSVAEHTLMLMLALSRQLLPVAAAMQVGDWYVRNRYSGDDLAGKTLGVVGVGPVGRRVARLASVLGMNVIHWSHAPFVEMGDVNASEGAPSAGDPSSDTVNGSEPTVALHAVTPPVTEMGPAVVLHELLERADVVSIHTRLTRETYHLIGEEELGLMKRSALLINTAGGGVIDQEALTAALKRGRPAGFAADVLEQEPPDPDDPLLSSDRTLITPRTASLTQATYRTMCVQTVESVLAVLEGEISESKGLFMPA